MSSLKIKNSLLFRRLINYKMEQVTRIELALAAWKAVVLPLNHTCINGRENRIRTCDIMVPNQALYQAELFPDNVYIILQTRACVNIIFNKMACPRGFEPPAYWSVVNRSIQLSYGHKKMAVSTGLEPAISSVTDWHVNHYTTRPTLALELYHSSKKKARLFFVFL